MRTSGQPTTFSMGRMSRLSRVPPSYLLGILGGVIARELSMGVTSAQRSSQTLWMAGVTPRPTTWVGSLAPPSALVTRGLTPLLCWETIWTSNTMPTPPPSRMTLPLTSLFTWTIRLGMSFSTIPPNPFPSNFNSSSLSPVLLLLLCTYM